MKKKKEKETNQNKATNRKLKKGMYLINDDDNVSKLQVASLLASKGK